MLCYFDEINQRLVAKNKHAEIMLVGGAALMLAFDTRNATYDIDAIFYPNHDMEEIIQNMAEVHELESDWLNDSAKVFVTNKMTFSTLRTYSNLTISNADAESLLAMKLIAARPYAKDMDDSVFLMKTLNIKSEQQAWGIVEKYTWRSQQTSKVKEFTAEAYERYRRDI